MVTRARAGKVTVNLTAIQSVFNPGGGVHNEAVSLGRNARGIASRSVKKRSGELAAGYRNAVSTFVHQVYVTLYTKVPHGKWYEDGTANAGLGRIYPRKGKTLRIPTGTGFPPRTPQQATSGFAHVRSVRGQRPKNTMSNAMRIALKMRGLL